MQLASLMQAFIKKTGAKNLEDLTEALGEKHYALDADSAPLVFECAAQGDQVALDLLEWAGNELGNRQVAPAVGAVILGMEQAGVSVNAIQSVRIEMQINTVNFGL